MALQLIRPEDFIIKPHDAWNNQWFALTSGDWLSGHYNSMTVAWGSFGTMWNKPIAQIVVRPTRYTYEFTEKYFSFTLCAFGPEHHKALRILGSRSGRDGDKIAQAGLTTQASQKVAAPSFAEASLIIECEIIYKSDFKPEQFLAPDIENRYPKKDYHRVYFGEILAVWG